MQYLEISHQRFIIKNLQFIPQNLYPVMFRFNCVYNIKSQWIHGTYLSKHNKAWAVYRFQGSRSAVWCTWHRNLRPQCQTNSTILHWFKLDVGPVTIHITSLISISETKVSYLNTKFSKFVVYNIISRCISFRSWAEHINISENFVPWLSNWECNQKKHRFFLNKFWRDPIVNDIYKQYDQQGKNLAKYTLNSYH